VNFLLLAGLEAAAGLALNCVHQEYPNKVSHVLNADADAQTPRALYPAFYGCFDWHSAVHGHWLLARLARLAPQSPLAAKARVALAQSLTAKNLEGEAAYMAALEDTHYMGGHWLGSFAAYLVTGRGLAP
jgi:hypothetical protein